MVKITLEAKIPEKSFMESLLNMKHSGYSENHIIFLIGIYALTHRWHINKFSHYWNLLEVSKDKNGKKLI